MHAHARQSRVSAATQLLTLLWRWWWLRWCVSRRGGRARCTVLGSARLIAMGACCAACPPSRPPRPPKGNAASLSVLKPPMALAGRPMPRLLPLPPQVLGGGPCGVKPLAPLKALPPYMLLQKALLSAPPMLAPPKTLPLTKVGPPPCGEPAMEAGPEPPEPSGDCGSEDGQAVAA